MQFALDIFRNQIFVELLMQIFKDYLVCYDNELTYVNWFILLLQMLPLLCLAMFILSLTRSSTVGEDHQLLAFMVLISACCT